MTPQHNHSQLQHEPNAQNTYDILWKYNNHTTLQCIWRSCTVHADQRDTHQQRKSTTETSASVVNYMEQHEENNCSSRRLRIQHATTEDDQCNIQQIIRIHQGIGHLQQLWYQQQYEEKTVEHLTISGEIVLNCSRRVSYPYPSCIIELQQRRNQLDGISSEYCSSQAYM